jgi:hypothetical protein
LVEVGVDADQLAVLVDDGAAQGGVREGVAGLVGADQAEAGDLGGGVAGGGEGVEGDDDQGLPLAGSGAAADEVDEGVEAALVQGAVVAGLLGAGQGVQAGR